MKKLFLCAAAVLMSAGVSRAADAPESPLPAEAGPVPGPHFLFGAESNGIYVGNDEADMRVRIRIQPRLEYGMLFTAPNGKSYAQGNDAYFRRARLEMGGVLYSKSLTYNLTFSADRWEQSGAANTVKLYNAFLAWAPRDEFSIRAGKAKLPYSRVSLIPDQTLLLLELPVSSSAGTNLFGGVDPYYQPHLLIKGKVWGGVIGYDLAAGDGWQNGETIYKRGSFSATDAADTVVTRGGALTIARIEVSPPGWVEAKKSDAPLTKGKHLTLAGNYAAQKGIGLSGNAAAAGIKEDRVLLGYDLSGHYKNLTMMYEYNTWTIRGTAGTKKPVNPRGWFLQAGYFIDALDLNIEPVARYEMYNQNGNIPEARERTFTAGVNWYLKGHSLKMGATWAQTRYEKNARGRLAEKDMKYVCTLQTQVYF